MSESQTEPSLLETQPAVSVKTDITFTLRRPLYTYLHLRASTQKSAGSTNPSYRPSLDEITVRQYLAQALTQYLGLTGAAISIDILKVHKQDAWVRITSDDENAVITSLAQWSGKSMILMVRGKSSWLGSLVANETSPDLWTMAS